MTDVNKPVFAVILGVAACWGLHNTLQGSFNPLKDPTPSPPATLETMMSADARSPARVKEGKYKGAEEKGEEEEEKREEEEGESRENTTDLLRGRHLECIDSVVFMFESDHAKRTYLKALRLITNNLPVETNPHFRQRRMELIQEYSFNPLFGVPDPVWSGDYPVMDEERAQALLHYLQEKERTYHILDRP